MTDLTLTQYDPLLKEHYVKEKVRNLSFGKNTFLSIVGKNTRARGRKIIQPIDFRRPTNGGALFSTAKSNSAPSGYEAFELTRCKHYFFPTVDNETIEATADDESAFMPAFEEFDRAFKAAGDRAGRQLYGSRGGYVGKIAVDATYPVSGATVKLTDKADAFKFDKDMIVVLGTTDGTTGAPLAGTLTVSGLDRENGLITFSGNVTAGVASAAQGNFIFPVADFATGSVALNMAGLDDWLPGDLSTRATKLAASFYAVTRSDDADRLGGIYRDARGENLVETVIKLGASIDKHGGSPDTVLVNPEVLSDLMLLMEARKVRMETETTMVAGIGIRSVRAMVGPHDIKLYGDRNCPSSRLYMLQLDTWRLHSAGEYPRFLDRDGLLKRSETADSYEARVGGYGNLGCAAPGFNGVAQLS